jgi:hypothetical protein
MKESNPLFIIILLVSILYSCSGKENQSSLPGTSSDQETPGPFTVAREIVYDVEVINPYPEDEWMEESLSSLDHQALVDFVFKGIYQEKFKCYDIFEGTPISVRKIRRMEESGEFSREQIGKFQFQEEWILDPETLSFSKRVTEVRMGLQKFNDSGELSGYAPLLRVVL